MTMASDRPQPSRPSNRTWLWIGLMGATPIMLAVSFHLGSGNFGHGGHNEAVAGEEIERPFRQDKSDSPTPRRHRAPELDGGTAWLNTGKPLRLKDLRGKIVLLDFWTLCCINCIHTLPDLAKLEQKYANQLVVVGVHSPKFDSEKTNESIRKAILRYEIAHPVVNDADMKIWRTYRVHAWPTLALIDPEGNFLGMTNGEGRYELLDKVIGKVIEEHREKKTLNEKPLKFQLARAAENGSSPLF